jgi:osmotically-inducible protein OsmY
VTLTGTVANAGQKAHAEKVAMGIDGVKSVKNQLRIVADTSNSGTPKK